MYSDNRFVARLVGAAGAAAIVALIAPGVAHADTAQTPVGQLTATWNHTCNDFGAPVSVSVAGGFANTRYTAHAVRGFEATVTFTTNASGAGSGVINNAMPSTGWSGIATIVVDAGGQTGTVPVQIECSSPKGG